MSSMYRKNQMILKNSPAKIKNKIKSILGSSIYNLNYGGMKSDFFGVAVFCNKFIVMDMDDDRIIDIHNKYLQLKEDLANIFINLKIDFDISNYLKTDSDSVFIKFLGVPIDVDKGVDLFKDKISEFASIYNKIKLITSKYNGLDDRFFYLLNESKKKTNDEENRLAFSLYNHIVTTETGDAEIEEIISSFFNFNERINKLLKQSKSIKFNQVYIPYNNELAEDKYYYLFGEQIKRDAQDYEIIKVIDRAKVFENNIENLLTRFNVIDRYEVLYEKEVFLRLKIKREDVKICYHLDMDHNEIENQFKKHFYIK